MWQIYRQLVAVQRQIYLTGSTAILPCWFGVAQGCADVAGQGTGRDWAGNADVKQRGAGRLRQREDKALDRVRQGGRNARQRRRCWRH